MSVLIRGKGYLNPWLAQRKLSQRLGRELLGGGLAVCLLPCRTPRAQNGVCMRQVLKLRS